MKSQLQLLIIDPQNDFCDLPADYLPSAGNFTSQPALPVVGAHQDMLRIADLIARGANGISQIHLSLDSHHHIDIAHPTFWMDAQHQASMVPVGTFMNSQKAMSYPLLEVVMKLQYVHAHAFEKTLYIFF